MTLKWCATDETWWEDNTPCLFCGGPGITAPPELHTARHWRNPAEWSADGRGDE